MNDATLERLMMDAALGGLSDDVRELLMAHVAGDEKKTRELKQLRQLMDKAREAMSEECPDFGELSRAAKPDLRIERRMRSDRAVTWGGRIVAMAACLLIGFGIARMRPAKEIQVVVREKPANPPVVAVNDVRPATGDGELWSAQRIYKNAIEVNRNEKPRVGMKRIFQ